MSRPKPSKEQIKRWQQKNWEKNWDRNLLSFIMDNIIEIWKNEGTIVAPDWEVLGYLIGENRTAYLLHSLILLQKKYNNIFLIRKDGDLYLDYIPF